MLKILKYLSDMIVAGFSGKFVIHCREGRIKKITQETIVDHNR